MAGDSSVSGGKGSGEPFFAPLEAILPPEELETVEPILKRLPDPRCASIRLARVLAREETRSWFKTILNEKDPTFSLFRSLCRALSQSEFLTSILERDPSLLTSFESDEEFSRSSGPAVFRKELHRHLAGLSEGESFADGLARFRLHEIFRIAVRDLTERATIETLSRELSDLADFILEAAYGGAYAQTLLSHGVPWLPDKEGPAEMAVIGLGKHGGKELNFSSDLDLIFVHEGEGETDLDLRVIAHARWLETHPYARYFPKRTPTARTRGVSFETFFTQVGARFIELLSEPGKFGSIYRIDMRLRPEGNAGPLVRSLPSILEYYENWGERWERQALLRARVCAGSRRIGERFLQGVETFLYRKYVDSVEIEETLREIRELRLRSIAQAGVTPDEARRNVKNGPGGIRDIEFLVQAVQILYGGEYPELRVGNVFELLRRIHQSGLMGAGDYHILSNGYEFLRKVEHRIQMDDLQRYHLPRDERALETLARGLGYPDGPTLETSLYGVMEEIHSIFRAVFRVEEAEEPLGNILELKDLTPAWKESLESIGLTDPDSVFRSIQRLAADPESPHLNSKLRRLLKTILPRLFPLIRRSPRPDWAWKTFENVSLATPARSTFFSVAGENPQLLELLTLLGSSSAYLSEMLQSHPSLIDEIVDRSAFESSFRAEEFQDELDDRTQDNGRSEFFSRLRALRTKAEIRVAGRFVLGFSGIGEAVAELSDLAEFCLTRSIEELWSVGSVGLAVFALGKMGGKELGFRSDLDLIILADSRLQPSSETAHRLVSRLITETGKQTDQGHLFEMDLRLRPYGRNSPLVPAIDAALEYYYEHGQTWERLALTRCRPIWGRGVPLAKVYERILDWVFSSPVTEEVLEEIRRMRYRIQREKPAEILKAGPGGLLDIEFIVQTGQLLWGAQDPLVRTPSTIRALRNFVKKGYLEKTLGDILAESYTFLRDIENRLSLLGKRGSHGLPGDEETLEHLARCLCLAGSEKRRKGPLPADCTGDLLRKKDAEVRSRVREVFEEMFETGFEV